MRTTRLKHRRENDVSSSESSSDPSDDNSSSDSSSDPSESSESSESGSESDDQPTREDILVKLNTYIWTQELTFAGRPITQSLLFKGDKEELIAMIRRENPMGPTGYLIVRDSSGKKKNLLLVCPHYAGQKKKSSDNGQTDLKAGSRRYRSKRVGCRFRVNMKQMSSGWICTSYHSEHTGHPPHKGVSHVLLVCILFTHCVYAITVYFIHAL